MPKKCEIIDVKSNWSLIPLFNHISSRQLFFTSILQCLLDILGDNSSGSVKGVIEDAQKYFLSCIPYHAVC